MADPQPISWNLLTFSLVHCDAVCTWERQSNHP